MKQISFLDKVFIWSLLPSVSDPKCKLNLLVQNKQTTKKSWALVFISTGRHTFRLVVQSRSCLATKVELKWLPMTITPFIHSFIYLFFPLSFGTSLCPFPLLGHIHVLFLSPSKAVFRFLVVLFALSDFSVKIAVTVITLVSAQSHVIVFLFPGRWVSLLFLLYPTFSPSPDKMYPINFDNWKLFLRPPRTRVNSPARGDRAISTRLSGWRPWTSLSWHTLPCWKCKQQQESNELWPCFCPTDFKHFANIGELLKNGFSPYVC